MTTRTMGYDDLDRLLTVSAPNLWGNATYTYDALDNLTSSSISDGATRRTSTHNFDPATNLLKSVTSDVSAYGLAYVHDARGNITKRGNQEFVFDLANRMRSAKYKGTYTYDGHGRRVSVISTDGVNRVQVYGTDGKLRYAGITGITGSKYIYLGNHLIAEHRPGYTQYDHTDGLGSPVALTNSARSVVSRTRYEPYGATASGDTPAIGFTGHVNAPDIGLVYMQQRYYEPTIGRFMSVDPVTTDANSGESFNRFAYAGNNPYTYIDPDGRNRAKAIQEIVTALKNAISKAEKKPQQNRSTPPTASSSTSSPAARLPQDVRVNPVPPQQLPSNRPIGSSPTQNASAQQQVAEMKQAGYKDVRVNQQQVNAAGERCGTCRPDVQGTNPNGVREYTEYDKSNSRRGPAHEERLKANDPVGTVEQVKKD